MLHFSLAKVENTCFNVSLVSMIVISLKALKTTP